MNTIINMKKSPYYSLLRDLIYYGPIIVLAFAYGSQFGIKGDISENLVDWLIYISAALVFFLLLYRCYRLRSPMNADPKFNDQTVQDVDQAHKEGYRVWLVFPKTDEHRKDYLYRLRDKGYLISDKDGYAIDGFSEFNDSVSRNRMRIKVVVDNTKSE